MDLEAELMNFTGTEEYHPHPMSGLLFTDGVKFLALRAGALWLIDIIGSHQPMCQKDRMLRDFQLWKLVVAEDKSGVVTCERDTDDLAIKQEIEYTDFPLKEIKLYVENGVLMLISER